MLFLTLLSIIFPCLATDLDSQIPFNVVQGSFPVPNATRSFWTHGAPDANPLAREGSHGQLTPEADVCIIGSGITGVSAAYHLANANIPLNVAVLEARDFCSGATGRNGGHLTPSLFSGFRSRRALHGEADAVRSYLLEHHTASSILSFIGRHNLSQAVDLVHGGHLRLFFTQSEEESARADYQAAIKAGWNPDEHVRWLDANQMNETYGTPYPSYGTSFAHNLWPLKLVTQLYRRASASASLNLTLHTHTPVLSIKKATQAGRKWSLDTPRGHISCSTVIHATNAYGSQLVPSLSSIIIPTRGQIIAAETTVTSPESVRLPEAGSWGANAGFEYWFPRPNSTTVILGGGREASDGEYNLIDDSVVNPRVGETLRSFLPRVFAAIKMEVKVTMEWTGIMGYTKSGNPIVGKIADGQFITLGYNGHGMPRAYGCAEAIAGMIAAELQGKKWDMPPWFPKHYLIQ
ncbi:hypothetical protein M378DRAFT_84343 [Amanita muscaria Koide BX008]|uniref:FAD dependent oxidoreductase domain-containing protein n=1 Tax=Amanita muscaria (strain Koide BX008) TaxID=946122 RepID=A0A0C2SB60_AMAMK|nr:hypothetical protein M378DRAFT_84343 [Amanita muscaria Koide BX008]